MSRKNSSRYMPIAAVLLLLLGAGACTETETGNSGNSGSSGSSGSGGSWSGQGGAPIIRGAAPTEATATNAGPFTVRSYSNGFRDGPDFADADIYYPSGATAPFASIAIVPGFVSDRSWVGEWGPFLASHGIVAMVIDTNTLVDQPADRAAALADAVVSLKAENTRSGSPVFGQLDTTRVGIAGWSMGGGGTLYAATSDPTLRAAIAICPWEPLGRYDDDKVPTLLFAGNADILAGGMSQDFYDSIPSGTPKLLFEIDGGDHWEPTSPAGHYGAVGRFGLSWLKVYLEGDDRYRQFLTRNPGGLSDFRSAL